MDQYGRSFQHLLEE